MERAADSSFSAVVELHDGKRYTYRFVLDGNRGENGWGAEREE